MKSPDALHAVAEFHRTFRLPVEEKPLIPAEERCQLRVNLLREELREFEEAIQNKDIVEAADALADLQYVLSGAILELGLGEHFKALFDEVHRSNMSKTCATLEEAKATLAHYRQLGQEGRIEQEGELYLVYRVADGKVLKNINYSPANLADQLSK